MACRHTPEQVIAKVRQGQKMLNEGRPVIEVVKELQVTEATWYRWHNHYGSEKNSEASKRTKELEKENARLKRLLTERELAIDQGLRACCQGFARRGPRGPGKHRRPVPRGGAGLRYPAYAGRQVQSSLPPPTRTPR